MFPGATMQTLTESPIAVRAEIPPVLACLPADCTDRGRTGDRCYKRSADMGRWCDECRDGQPAGGPLPDWMAGVDEPRPTYEDVVSIGPIAGAEWAGFELGCNGLAVVGPAHYTPEEQAAFRRGHAAGLKAYEEAEAANWDLDDAPADWTHAEMVRAVGCIEARAEGSGR